MANNGLVSINNFTFTDILRIHGYDRTTGELELLLTELKEIGLATTEDTREITGKNDRLLMIKKYNKGVELTGSSALISGSLLSAQTGNDPVHSDTTKIRKVEWLTVQNGTATTSQTATGYAGAEIGNVYFLLTNGDIDYNNPLTQAPSSTNMTNGSKNFLYNPTTKQLQFMTAGDTKVADGTKIVVIYDYETEGITITNDSDTYSKTLAIYIDAIGYDTCDEAYMVQIVIPRGQFSGEFEINISGDQETHDFTVTNLVDTCSTSENPELYHMIFYKDDTIKKS